MTRLVLIDSVKMEKLLMRLGFEKKRQKGSHAFYKHPDGRFTTVPHHKGRKLARSLIREILREIDLSIDDYNELLKKN